MPEEPALIRIKPSLDDKHVSDDGHIFTGGIGDEDANSLDTATELKAKDQGRLLASFQDDAKYEHGGQDTRSHGVKRRSRQKDKDLKILDEKTKSKDNDKRLKIKDHKS
uniref:Uncharacterized protein n=1 Tax=Tanacetum cinerariifolium TaxID=118510 RepID=A0A699KQ50_TANCI|nr:hypothetical protein [Tanacetum cinerariifolium]